MRKIINGKMYDTDKAELIYSGYDLSRTKKRDYYRTSKGTFLCHYVSVNRLEIVPDESMMEILAEYAPDKYIEIFGNVEEG